MEASTSKLHAIAEDSSTDLRAPRWLNKRVGRFRLLGLLGKGSFGRVFLAEDIDLQRRVALKILTADATARRLREDAHAEGESMETTGLNAAVSEAVDRMIREARAAARLEHPGVVQIFEIGRLESQGLGGFIAMELLEGGTLQQLVKASGPLPIQQACTFVAEAAEALQYAHDAGVVHRDVKPGNLMISRNGHCKVADFGLACISDAEGEQDAPKGGTAAYMAPEVILGGRPDHLSDQYALAAALYAVLAGHAPFRGETKREILLGHLKSRVPNLREIRREVDEHLWMVIRRGLCKHPPKRFPTMREFAEALAPHTGNARTKLPSSEFFGEVSLEQVLGPQEPVEIPKWMTGEAAPPSSTRKSFIPGVRSTSPLLRWPPPRWVGYGAAGLVMLLLLVVLLSLLAGGSADSAREQPSTVGDGERSAAPTNAGALHAPAIRRDQVARASEQAGSAGRLDRTASGSLQVGQQEAAAHSTLFVMQDSAPATRQARGGGSAATAPASRPSFIPASEYDRLLRIARGEDPEYADRRASVGGKVVHARTSDTGKVFRIYFEGTDRGRSFGVVYFPSNRTFQRMQEKFGGKDGSGMEGKVIRVTGRLSIYQDNPQIIVESPDQIEIVGDKAE